MYSQIILYLQLFTVITGWQENMVETQSPQTYPRGVLSRGRTRNAVIFVKIGSVKSYLTDVHSEFLVYIPHYLAYWSEVLYRGWTRNAVIFVKIGPMTVILNGGAQ